MPIGETFIGRNGKKIRSLLNGIRKPTPRPPVVIASRIPCDSVAKKSVTQNKTFRLLPKTKLNTPDQSKANSIECVKPLCPSGCAYGMPKLKVKTSISGKIAEPIARKTSKALDLLSATLDNVYPNKP